MTTNVQVVSTRTSFNPDGLNVTASNSTPFVSFDNGVNFYLQADGNIVAYNAGTPLWASKSNSGTGDPSKLTLRFQDDGNLVEYLSGKPVFASDTAGKGKKLLVSDRSPYLIILDADGNIAWSSKQDKKAT
ncbi:MAG: hypothetical protein MMC33_008865 [Icmadophila ericetorum]|nr:hypothetical protein [Icmadophila ericetorum]